MESLKEGQGQWQCWHPAAVPVNMNAASAKSNAPQLQLTLAGANVNPPEAPVRSVEKLLAACAHMLLAPRTTALVIGTSQSDGTVRMRLL